MFSLVSQLSIWFSLVCKFMTVHLQEIVLVLGLTWLILELVLILVVMQLGLLIVIERELLVLSHGRLGLKEGAELAFPV